MTREPFTLTIDQIWDLDPWLVPNIYFHPRDKHGDLLLSAKPGTKKVRSQREWWIEEHKKFDIPKWFILDEWDKIQEQVRIGKEMIEKFKNSSHDPSKLTPEALASFMDQGRQPTRERQDPNPP